MTTRTDSHLSHDRWYDGSLYIWQPKDGLRATTDAVLLAAAIPVGGRVKKRAIEFGAGCGAVALALNARCAGGGGAMDITAVERDGLMAELLARNITENNAASITPIHADIFDAGVAGAWRGQYDIAFSNPPYNDAGSSLSPDGRRRDAMSIAAHGLGEWIAAMLDALKPKGRLVLVARGDRLCDVTEALGAGDAGEIVIKPVHSVADAPAIRVLVSARKGVAGPPVLLAPLVMRDGAGESAAMSAIAHARGAIDLAHPRMPR